MSSHKSRRSRRPFLAAAAAGAVALAVAYVPTATAVQPASTVSSHTMYDISVRALNGDGQSLGLRLMARGFDVLEKREGAVVHVLGGQATVRALAGVGGATVVAKAPAAPTGQIPKAPKNQDDILPKKLKGKHYPTYYGGYRTVAGYDQFETDVAKAYPTLAQKITFGKTFTGKYDLNVMCITADADKGCKLTPNVDKARFLLETHIHAREVATDEMAWRYITMLLDGYNKDPQITSLLNSTEVWIDPEINPDGSNVTQKGIEKDGLGDTSPAWQRKNWDRDQTPAGGCAGSWAGSQPGIDLNRNWPFAYGGASTSKDPCSEVFIGTGKLSEPESQALAKLTKELFKDQKPKGAQKPAPKDTTGEMLTFHTDGGVNLIPWDYTATVQAPNDQGLRTLGFRQSFYTGLPTGQSGQVLYNVGGGTDDWAYATLGIAAGTWELADTAGCGGFFPPYSCMDSFAKTYLPGLLYTTAAARAPYMLSLGPTVTDVSAKAGGSTVTVTAKADDNAFGSGGVGRPTATKVTDARIYVGTAPWDGGKATAMKVKGSGTSATATADVKPGSKKTMAWVQAKNANGDWGPAVAVWIPAK